MIVICSKLMNSCSWFLAQNNSHSVVVNIGRPITTLLIFKDLVTAAKCFELPFPPLFNGGLRAKHIVYIASILRWFCVLLELGKENRAN